MNTKPMNKLFICNGFRVLLALAFSLSLAGVLTVPARALVYVVSNLNDSGAGSLRQAILNANAHAGADTITFSVSGTITLLSGLPVISESLTIDGAGQKVKVSGNDHYRVFEINEHAGLVTINNLGIVRGLGSSGGGIDFWGLELTVNNSTFSGNHASGSGGAIYSSCMTPGITLRVINSTFSGNSAVYGGALYNCWDTEFEEYEAGVLIVKNSTFSGNSASGNGADIANKGGYLDVSNSILANSAGGANCYSTKGNAGAYNLIENNSGCGTPMLASDPRLGPLAYNGGPTQTFALQPISPAIGAGDDATCAADPVFNVDQRGVERPLGSHCDIGSYEAPVFRSVTTSDGWILESSENSGVGGTLNSSATTVRLGDEAGDKQYRTILSFNTETLQNDAVITKAVLKIKKQGQVGTNPFGILGGLKVDIRKPYFGPSLALLADDFQAPAGRTAVGTFGITPVLNWYSATLSSSAYPYINRTGTTQFRLYFTIDDNDDNAADYMTFISGNYAATTLRPTLVIEFNIP